MFARRPRSIAALFVFGGTTAALVALVLPAGVFLGAPIHGYTLLLASFASLAGPFHQWQDFYIALSAPVNVALYLVLPLAVTRAPWLRPLAIVAWLCAAYVASYPVAFSESTSSAYFAWLAAAILSASGYVGLTRRHAAVFREDQMKDGR
jgi:hypothetical protein